jgi:hypothetical protein
MSKNITLTAVDEVHVRDSAKKTKTLQDQGFEEYKVDPIKIFERTGLLKNIPSDWIPEILLNTINSCKTPRTFQNINKNEKTIVLGFESKKDCNAFYGDPDKNDPGEFNNNLISNINNFIISKNEQPKKYNRIIVVENTIDKLQITIRF